MIERSEPVFDRWTSWASRRFWRLAIDVFLACTSFALAMVFHLGASGVGSTTANLVSVILFGGICLACFLLTGFSFRSWRFVTIPDIVSIVRDIGIPVAVFLLITRLFTPFDHIPSAVPLIAFFIMIATLGGARVSYRGIVEGAFSIAKKSPPEGSVHILVYGATHETDAFLRALQSGAGPDFHVAGVIDDEPNRRDHKLRGVKVLGTLSQLKNVTERLAKASERPEFLVVPAGGLSSDRLREIVFAAAEAGLRTSRLPSARELLDKAGSAFAFEPVQVSDLLCREPVALDLDSIDAMIRGKSIVVTGGGGSIGSELCRHLLMRSPAKLVIVEHSEYNLFVIQQELAAFDDDGVVRTYLASVRDARQIQEIFTKEQVDLVFHAAAYKHVPLVEMNPLEGVLTNVVGTANVADAAVAVGAAAMILVSTDKAVKPANIMGLSKRVAEIYCQALDRHCMAKGKATRFIVVRFGNVLGSSGSVVPIFEDQIRRGGPVTITHPDMTRYFMTIPEAVELMLQGSAFGLTGLRWRGAILVLDMGLPVSITDLARRMIMLAGLIPDRDVAIKYVGLRPGEKLHEELFDDGELIEETGVCGIRLARSRALEFAQVYALREALLELTINDSAATIKELLKSFSSPERSAVAFERRSSSLESRAPALKTEQLRS